MLAKLASALRDLPPRQAAVGRYVLRHPFDAATRPMRALARHTAQSPATFTRLAQSLGLAGWEDLRALIVAETRADLEATRHAPFSTRIIGGSDAAQLATSMLETDLRMLGACAVAGLEAAAAVIEQGRRVLVAGFRSCHAPASLFHYLYRLFHPEVTLVTGAGGLLDLEIGGLRGDDVLVLFGFDPYSRDSLLAARAAAGAGSRLVAIVDAPDAPIAEGAAALLTFGTASPGFFPSLTGCVSLVQALAAILYLRAGEGGTDNLRRTEARIAAHTAYLGGRADGG